LHQCNASLIHHALDRTSGYSRIRLWSILRVQGIICHSLLGSSSKHLPKAKSSPLKFQAWIEEFLESRPNWLRQTQKRGRVSLRLSTTHVYRMHSTYVPKVRKHPWIGIHHHQFRSKSLPRQSL